MSTDTNGHATQDSTPEQVLGRVEEAIVSLDADWTFGFVNQAAADLLGREEETLLGKSIWETFDGAAETAAFEEFHGAMETGEPTRFDMHYDPQDVWLTVRAYPGPEGLTVCFDDITRERERQFALERKRRLFEAVFEDTEDALVIADTDRRITDFNPAAEQLFGYDEAEILGEKSAVLYADDADYEQTGEERFNEQATERHDSYVVEYERADGTTFPGETVGTPLEGQNGETLAFLGAIRDVSARAEYEQLIEARNEALRTFHDITTDRTRTFEDRLTAVLELGRDHLGLEVGILADVEGTEYTVESVVGSDTVEPGATVPLGERFCDFVVELNDVASIASVPADDLDQHPASVERGVESYLGAPVVVDREPYGTLSFSSSTPRETPFTESEKTFVRVLAQWVGEELARRRQRERARANRDRLRQVVDMLPQLVFAKDESGEFLLANESVAEAYGTTVEDLEGAVDTDFADSREEARQFRADDRAVIESGEPKHIPEEPLTTADGEQRVFETTKIPYDPVETDGAAVLGVATDITDRRERERELQRQRTRLRALFDKSPDGIVIHDDGGAVLDVNDTQSELLGYDVEELLSMNVAEFEAGISRSELRELWDGMDLGEILKVEGNHRTQSGASFPVEVWVNKLLVNGEVRYIAVSRDITERKARERKLRESRETLREVSAIGSDTDRDFDAKLDGILELGCDHLGLPYGFLNRIDDDTQHVVESIGTHPMLQPGESAPLSKAYCRRTIEQDHVLDVHDAVEEGWSGDQAYEEYNLGCYIGGKVIVDGKTYGTLCFADIESRSHEFDDTERAFVELLVQWISYELKSDRVERKLRQLNETAQRSMTTTERGELLSVVTESARSVLGLPMTAVWWYDEQAEALVPATMTDEVDEVIDEQPTFEGGASLAWQAFQDGAVRAYDDLQAVEGRYNEDTRVVSEVIVPLGEHGVLISGATERHAFSDTDRNLLEVLAATVEEALNRVEREQDLRETRERLEQSNRELEQFAYAASHDLQEPLRTVSSYLTLLERRYRDELDEEAREFVEIAVDGADRMRDMIRALLRYSRVETRSGAFEPTEMTDVFDQVERNLEVTIEETDATVSYPASMGTVVGDDRQLVQLFQNLVENGIKYSEGDPSVDISVQRRDGRVEFAVSDTGIGIESDRLDGIFEVFQRLHTREEFDGTGIGLSVCRKIVDRHDGDIRVESTPGVGSTFFVTLPGGGESRE